MYMIEKINEPKDLKNLNYKQLETLAKEIRTFLIESIAKTGGHLGSNLGVVELTIVLNYLYDFKDDAIVFDVGHQSYVHKILTGRKKKFNTLREFDGICGFPSVSESVYDHFDTGHASTSISAAVGIAKAFELQNKKNHTVCIIGDGALSGGLAYEALNNVHSVKSPFLIVLNDNEMSISKNVGGLSKYLSLLRTSKGYNELKSLVKKGINKFPFGAKGISKTISKAKKQARDLFTDGDFFESLGIKYIGPIDGHNIPLLIDVIKNIKESKEPILLHLITKKGKGYSFAENDPVKFHGVEPFDYDNGDFYQHNNDLSYTKFFGNLMVEMGEKHKDIIAITAAMSQGTGLELFKNIYDDRFFDVGIAEGHALTFAAGLASKGLRPVVAIYSTFLQRGLDQIIHDICLQKLPVIIAVDRAGIVGKDGKTHQGLFDIGFLSYIPNLTILNPSTRNEMKKAFEYAYKLKSPVVIRYPKGPIANFEYQDHNYVLGQGSLLKEGKKGLIIGLGHLVDDGIKLAEEFDFSYLDARFIKPLDEKYYRKLCKDYEYIFVLEEVSCQAGFNNSIRRILNRAVYSLSLPDDYLRHGSINDLRKLCSFDFESLKQKIASIIYK